MQRTSSRLTTGTFTVMSFVFAEVFALAAEASEVATFSREKMPFVKAEE